MHHLTRVSILASIAFIGCSVERDEREPSESSHRAAVTPDTGTRCLIATNAVVTSAAPPTVIVFVPIESPSLPSSACSSGGGFTHKAVVYTNGVASPPQCLTASDVQALTRTSAGGMTAEIWATLPAPVAAIITCPP